MTTSKQLSTYQSDIDKRGHQIFKLELLYNRCKSASVKMNEDNMDELLTLRDIQISAKRSMGKFVSNRYE
jgi:hypothetical protein